MSITITRSNPSCNFNSSCRFSFKSHNHNNPNFYFNFCYRGSHSYPFHISCKFSARNKHTIQAKGTSSNDSQEPGTGKSSSSGWKKWVMGLMLSIILPSFGHKWGPLLMLKTKVDSAMEIVETMTEVVEEIAEEAEKLAEELEKKLPEDTKLREAAEMIEHLAKEAVKEADLAQELIHKVHDVEEEIEALMKSSAVDEKIVSQEMELKTKDAPLKS